MNCLLHKLVRSVKRGKKSTEANVTSETGMPENFQDVTFAIDGGVGLLTLNRPSKLNALTLAMHRKIFESLSETRRDARIRVLVITGTGRAFCAGDDMHESDPREGIIPPEAETEIAWHNMVRQMHALPKPVIAAVNGLACGAGGGLLLGSDIRIASESARFADIFTRRGIAGGACLLTQTIGTAKALELIFTGDFVDAADGHRLGIFNRVVPHDRLMEETLALARRLVEGPAQAYGYSKLAVYQAAAQSFSDGLRSEEFAKLCCLRGAEVREGIEAFNDKRRAAFANS
jgi:2-(1,2-epoxy-1,2-dihydrophenyl)acetyl-CoA isomerase